MGGIAIFLGFTSSMVALTPPWEPLGWIMAGGLPLIGIGMLDDYFAISSSARFAAQMGAAADGRVYIDAYAPTEEAQLARDQRTRRVSLKDERRF